MGAKPKRRPPCLRLSLVAASLLVVGGGLWEATAGRDDLERGRTLLAGGEYAEALEVLARDSSTEAKVLTATALFKTGAYAKAIKVATGAARKKGTWQAEAFTVAGKAYFETGRYDEAVAAFDQAASVSREAFEAILLRGMVKEQRGDRKGARRDYYLLFDAYEAGSGKTSLDLTHIARAVAYAGDYHSANGVLRDEVLEKDPKLAEAWITRAELFLDRYDSAYATELYEKALAINAHDPRALAGMALAIMEDTNQAPKILVHVDRALVINPHHPFALSVKARVAIDDEDFHGALKIVGELLKTNPRYPLAFALQATAHYLLDDMASFKKSEAKALALNPKYAGFYNIVSDYGIKFHRYEEVPELLERAIAIDPKNGHAVATMGLNATRLGDDKKGKALLDRAYKLDRFNIRTVNMINLYDKYILPNYEWIETGMWRVRVPKKQRKILEMYVPALLGASEKVLSKHYGGRAYSPTHVELFDNPAHFATRTIGLPGLGASGVCFGRVITSISPSLGRFNWSETLWHEMAHTYHIKLSRGRVPRWLTEGLATYEETKGRPHWARENDRDLYWALKSKRLRGVAEMSLAFTRARGMSDILAAYYNASLVAEFLVKKAGLKKVVTMLKGYGRGKTTPGLLKAATGMTMAKFDAAYWAWLRKDKLAYLSPGFDVDMYSFPDVVTAEEALKKSPDSANRMADLAVALVVDGKFKEALKIGKRALRKDPGNKVALYLLAEGAFAKRDIVLAKGFLLELLDAGGDGFAVRSKLAQVMLAEKRWELAIEHARAATKFDPKAAMPYRVIAQVLDKKGRRDEAARNFETLISLDQHDVGSMKWLMRYHGKRAAWADVARVGEMALEVALFDKEIHEGYAMGLIRSGMAKSAKHKKIVRREIDALRFLGDSRAADRVEKAL